MKQICTNPTVKIYFQFLMSNLSDKIDTPVLKGEREFVTFGHLIVIDSLVLLLLINESDKKHVLFTQNWSNLETSST